MIAVVILGIGLLIVASVFPVAWTKAREQVEATNIANTVQTAETLLKPKLRATRYVGVDGDGNLDFDQQSFLGDLGTYLVPEPPNPPVVTFTASPTLRRGVDTNVHPINVYNMLASPQEYEMERSSVAGSIAPQNEVFVEEALYRVETTEAAGFFGFEPPPPQIRFEDRVIPALPLRIDTTDPPLDDDERGTVNDWNAKLRLRRYGWAALARINNGDEWSTPLAREGIVYEDPSTWDAPRYATMYYVTLRRSYAGERFPQQDHRQAIDDWPPHQSSPDYPGNAARPKALPAAFDVLLPTPWRVQVSIVASSLVDLSDPAAVPLPAEVAVNLGRAMTGPIVMDLLPRGAYMIDELNGNVYKVVRERVVTNDAGERAAVLTLDSAITVADVTLPGAMGIEPDRDLLRTVWVFPPDVEQERDVDGNPVFAGSNPVVGIEVRTEVVRPQ